MLIYNVICRVSVHPPLTAHVKAGSSQDASVRSVAHQVVSGPLLGSTEAVKGDAEDAGGHHTVGAAGHARSVQRPVQSAGVHAELRAQRARGR